MANEFSSNYVIAVTLENLKALKELRAELRALREDSKDPINFSVNVKPNTADNIGKVVEQKVAEGIEKGTAKAKRSRGTAAGGKDVVAFDPASLQRLDSMIGKLVTALGNKGAGSGEVAAKIDPKAIADAVASGVKEGLAAHQRSAPRVRTEERALTPDRRKAIKDEADALNASVTPRNLKKVTELNQKEVLTFLEKRAELLGGEIKKQTKQLIAQTQAAIEAAGAGGSMSAGKEFDKEGRATTHAVVDGIQDTQAKIADILVERTQKLLKESEEALGKRVSDLDTQLKRGTEQVTRRSSTSVNSSLNAQMKRSTRRLENAFDAVGNKIVQQLGVFTDTLVDRISSMTLNVNAVQLADQAATEAARPGRRLARAPQRKQGNPNLPESILGNTPEAARQATIRSGLKALEEMRARERKRTANQKSFFERQEAAFMSLPPGEARTTFDEARRYNTYLNQQHTDAVRGAFGNSFGEDVAGGGVRVPFRVSQQLNQAIRLRQQIDKGGQLTAKQVQEYAYLSQNPHAKALLDASPNELPPMIEAAKVVGRQTKLSRFTRAEMDLPRWSPVALSMTEQHLRATGNTTDADDLKRFLDRGMKRATQAGFEFTSFGNLSADPAHQSPEIKAILTAMADVTGLREGEAFGKKTGGFQEYMKRRVGTYYNMQGKLQGSPEEMLSDLLGFGGEWHHGPFKGFVNPVFQPEIRDLAANAPIIDSGLGVNPMAGKVTSRQYDEKAARDFSGDFERARAWRNRGAAGTATETAIRAAVEAATGGGGGAGVPPHVPPTGGAGTPPGDGGMGGPPGGWREFAAAMKALEHMRLDGLAADFKSMAASMADMRKNGGSQWQQWLKAAGATGRLREMDGQKELEAARHAARAAADAAKLEKTRIWAETMGAFGVRKMGEGIDTAMLGALGPGADLEGLSPYALATRFGKLENQLGSKQLKFDELLNTYGPGGGRDPRTVRALQNAATEMTAKRQTMMDTILAAAPKNRRLDALGGDIADYAKAVQARMQAESERGAVLHDLDMSPKVPEAMRSRIDSAMLRDLNTRRMAEDALASSILKRGAAEFKTMRDVEQHGTFIDRLSNKIKSLTTYALAGGLIYAGYGALRAGFSGAVDIEKQSADIQGVIGNRTPAERDQVRSGVLQAAIDYGSPNIGAAMQTAKLFAQAGYGADRTVSMTRAALSGQLGAGLDAGQSTEMLLAVDNITKGAVQATDILDRISHVEAKYAVSAQDLSVAIQKVGSIATQLQPNRVGRLDAFDTVLGSITVQQEKTRAGGDVAANALKFILSRLGSPEIMKRLQDSYGIKLAANKEGTELRPLIDIFSDISKTYKELLAKEKNGGPSASGIALQFLSTVAGQRQANQAAALFGGFDEVLKVATESARAWGDTQRRVVIQMDTFAFQLDRMKNASTAFISELLKSAGVLSLLKGGTNLLGTAADLGRGAPGVTLLAGGALSTGLAFGARRAATSGLVSGAAASYAAGGTGVGAFLGGEASSLFTIIGTVLARIGMVLAGLGAVAAVLGVATWAIKRYTARGPLENPDLNAAKLYDSDLYKNYTDYAQRNGMAPAGLVAAVQGAALRAQQTVSADARYKDIKNDIFTTDDDRRKYAKTLADQTTAEFTKEIAKAVPEIRNIKDASERASAALMLLKQSSQVAQMQSSYTASYQDEQLHGLTSKMQEELRKMMGEGVFGFTANGNRNVFEDIQKVMGRAFGVFSSSVNNTRLTDAEGHLASMMRLVGDRMREKGETFGQALDNVAEATLSLTNEQNLLVEKIKGQGGLSFDPTKQRLQLIQALAGSHDPNARGAMRVLNNQRKLEDSIYNGLTQAIPLVENGVGNEKAGGLRGTNLIFEAILAAGRRRTEDLRKAGLTGPARAMEETLTTMQSPDNRAAFDMLIARNGNYKATFRDRILEQIIRYGQADDSARFGGGALKSLGIRTDVTAERAQAANSLVRGLYDARAQGNGDILRAASQLAAYDDLKNTLGQATGGLADTGLSDSPERSAIVGKLMQSAGALDPKERERLALQLRVAKQVAAQVNDNADLFSGLDPEAQGIIKHILSAGFNNESLANQALAFAQITKISERIAKVMDDRLTEEKRQLQFQQNAARLDNTLLQLSQEEVKTKRDAQIRHLETFGGSYASITQQRAGIEQTYQDALARSQSEYTGKLGVLDVMQTLYGEDGALERAQAAADKHIADLQAGSQRTRSSTDLEAAYKDSVLSRLRDFDMRREEIFGGPMGQARAALAYAVPNSPAATEAVRAYRLSIAQREMQQYQTMTQGSLQGVRGSLTSYDTFKGTALGARIIKPAADTLTNQITNSFLTTLTGPDGLFGRSLGKFFNSQFFLEADLIRNAHISGITAGFLAAKGSGLIGMTGADLSSEGGIADASTVYGHANVSPIGRKEQLNQLMLTGGAIAGNIFGGQIGTKRGVNYGSNYGSEGAQIGSTLGTALGSMTPLGPLGGAIGGMLGGLVGGLFGGRVGKNSPQPISALDRIERNTRETVTAVQNQTRVLTLENRLLNVPASFRIPGYAIAGGGAGATPFGFGGTNVQIAAIHINGAQSPQATADALVTRLRTEARGAGSFVSPRSTRN